MACLNRAEGNTSEKGTQKESPMVRIKDATGSFETNEGARMEFLSRAGGRQMRKGTLRRERGLGVNGVEGRKGSGGEEHVACMEHKFL